MESYRLPFCVVIALWLQTVQVIADQRPVLGQGNISCSLWLEGRQTDSPSAASRTGWVLGFMSAFNQFGTTSERTDVSEGKSSEELMAWIDSYCRQHQGDHLHMALQAFIDDFRKKSSTWISEFARTRTHKPAAKHRRGWGYVGCVVRAKIGGDRCDRSRPYHAIALFDEARWHHTRRGDALHRGRSRNRLGT